MGLKHMNSNNTETASVAETPKRLTLSSLSKMMQEAKNLLKMQEQLWAQMAEEFEIRDDQLKTILEYNDSVRKPLPEAQQDEDGFDNTVKEYDPLNGLDDIPDERIIDIFGSDSPIIGLTHSQTVDRLKSAIQVFYDMYTCQVEYHRLEVEFAEEIERQEQESLDLLKKAAENETDPDKQARAQTSLDRFLSNKYLGFMAEILTQQDLGWLIMAYSDRGKIRYSLDKSRRVLQQMGIPEAVILQLSNFEKRLLPEKYHGQSNLLLLKFLGMIVHERPQEDKFSRHRIISFVLGIDKLVKRTWSDEEYEKVINNLMAFEDQFIGKIGSDAAWDGN